jgi:hypothetical protein
MRKDAIYSATFCIVNYYWFRQWNEREERGERERESQILDKNAVKYHSDTLH